MPAINQVEIVVPGVRVQSSLASDVLCQGTKFRLDLDMYRPGPMAFPVLALLDAAEPERTAVAEIDWPRNWPEPHKTQRSECCPSHARRTDTPPGREILAGVCRGKPLVPE